MTAPIMASSKQVSYYCVPEVTEGETPANPVFIRIPKKPGELTLKRETFHIRTGAGRPSDGHSGLWCGKR
ncbi:hypothetical protein G6T08_004687 [Salmonella enterica]|uniref:hypothetical protein n=1 Tax=Salmonella enterica TaxID=28901 RepID=UPI001124DB84|nr:hypothetical protein [Salmonella enterica]EIM5533098.1 hypothetical protein [Salmonella enterica subsp. enterica]ELD8112054.1 hypothetical protein [Salmonella enterica subsp. enterica serovar Benin]EBC1279454.1 hypothetical protein [Salmonella enterica]EBE6989074.1 hypothetical protein [Salmonella enterica]EBE7299020.1 hypothetical protein [Salmonella enterica]